MPGYIEWLIERVDMAIRKHGLTRDPHLDARAKAFLEGRPREVETVLGRVNQYADRSPGQLAKDVNRLTDLLVDLVRERDQLLMEAESQRSWIRLLRYVVSAEGLIILFLAQQLFSRLH